jgi:sigma-E factor negative regulatory protein RseA
MSDNVKASLSALMDNEINEMEFQKILSNSDDDNIRQTWQRYHMTRTVLREGSFNAKFAGFDISRQVSAALESESAYKTTGGFKHYLKPVLSFAIAASVATVIVISGHFSEDSTPVLSQVANPGSSFSSPSYGISAVVVNAPSVNTVNAAYEADTLNIKQSTADHSAVYNSFARQRLQRFMLHNAQHSAWNSNQGMMPLARVVTIEVE